MEINENIKKECMKISSWCVNFNSDFWIRLFINGVDWKIVSSDYNLSEDFIDYFEGFVDWYNISKYQKLSENFIEKFKYKVNWDNIVCFQDLSSEFIKKYENKIDWYYIIKYERNCEKEFIEKYRNKFSKFIWNLKLNEEKESDIKNAGYEILNDENGKYILSYKAIREDNKSFTDPYNYEYIGGKIYESRCNCDVIEEYSYGLGVWEEKNAIEFGKSISRSIYLEKFKLIKVKIYINDIGAIIKNKNNMIRCFKFEVVEDLGVYKNENE